MRYGFFLFVQDKLNKDGSHTTSLKSLSMTRWSARINNSKAFLRTIESVVETLAKMQDAGSLETASTAMALSGIIHVDFCLQLVASSGILAVTGVS